MTDKTHTWITAENFSAATDLLEDLETFMTTEVAVQIPAETPVKLIRILEGSKAIRTFKMNTGFSVSTLFAIAVR